MDEVKFSQAGELRVARGGAARVRLQAQGHHGGDQAEAASDEKWTETEAEEITRARSASCAAKTASSGAPWFTTGLINHLTSLPLTVFRTVVSEGVCV